MSDDILQFGPAIVAHYNDDDVQSWVNQIISGNHLPKASSCIVILNPREVLNTDADLSQGILGYHDKADAPYLFVNVLGTGLTVQDRANFYADTLSHEIAEMVCDPDVSWFNHEVCDGCAGNCNNNWRNFFADPSPSVANSYIQSAKDFPPAFPFTFFTASVARPSHADDCPAPDNACAYESPPHLVASAPIAVSWGSGRLDVFAQGTDKSLQHWWWYGAGWGSESLGGALASAPAAVSWGSNRLDVFAQGTNESLQHWWWDGAGWGSE